VLGAILVFGSQSPTVNGSAENGEPLISAASRVPLTCIEVLGRSVVERIAENFQQSGVDAICIFSDRTLAHAQLDMERATTELPVDWLSDAWGSVTGKLKSYRDQGIKTAFVMCMDAYAEFEPLDALQFHRDQNQVVTRLRDEEGPLNIWIVDLTQLTEDSDYFGSTSPSQSYYTVDGYVNRLQSAKDLRRLVADSLTANCQLRPVGTEIRPGVWLGEGAQVHRGAQINAPAFIGRNSKVGDGCLVTRCSNIESDCEIDFGTVVEDSSVLSNSYIGIGLDISHSIVNGKNLLNLKRNQALEIADAAVIRENIAPHQEMHRSSPVSFGLEGMLFEPAE
jgi:NDP-sugar pyrophosphorylase family protein